MSSCMFRSCLDSHVDSTSTNIASLTSLWPIVSEQISCFSGLWLLQSFQPICYNLRYRNCSVDESIAVCINIFRNIYAYMHLFIYIYAFVYMCVYIYMEKILNKKRPWSSDIKRYYKGGVLKGLGTGMGKRKQYNYLFLNVYKVNK